jgi:cytoskeleton-associated protein 5
VPKICAASLVILKEAIKQFGPKALPIKPVLAAFASFFDHADKTVRAEAFSLVVELYRWLGPVMQKQIENLRPAQVKELEAAFQDIQPGKAVPEKYLRSQVPQFGAVADTAQGSYCRILC